MPDVVFKANLVNVLIDGQEFTLLSDIRASDDYGLQEVSGIGDIHVKEYPPSLARHEFTLNGYVTKPEPSWSDGIIPENGDAALTEKVFTIEIFDKKGPLLRKYLNASCNRGEASLAAHRLIMKNAQFFALDAVGTFV